MLCTRVIPIVLLEDGRAVISTRFEKPRRPVGSIESAIRLYEARTVDEIVLLSLDTPADAVLAQRIGDLLRTPFSIGGGISSTDQAARLIASGADKVVIRTHAEEVIPSLSKRLGSQAIIAAVDAHNPAQAREEALHMQTIGAGEILLQSVSRDGTLRGPDLDLIGEITHALSIPVIYAGGICSPQDAVEVIHAGADAVGAAAAFHFTQTTPFDLKLAMRDAGVYVRIPRKGAA